MQQSQPNYYIRIVEQPAKEIRFRYKKEKRSSSDRPVGSNESNKVFPILTTNYRGDIKIVVVLVDKNKKPHPHSLVGPKCTNGICMFEYNVTDDNCNIVFTQNVGIQCARKPDVSKEMEARQGIFGGDPFYLGYDPEAYDSIDLHEVRLAIIPSLRDASGSWCQLQPIATDVIRDSKASLKLNITDTSSCQGRATGNTQLILLTDTVYDPSTVKVLFFGPGWQAYAQIMKVHKSVAFVIRAPPYRDINITESVKVKFVLTRKSDCDERGARSYDLSDDPTQSNVLTFDYVPGPPGEIKKLQRAKPSVEVPSLNSDENALIRKIYNELERNMPEVTSLIDEFTPDYGPPPLTPLTSVSQDTYTTQQQSVEQQQTVLNKASSSTAPHSPMDQASSIRQHSLNGQYIMDSSSFTGPSTSKTRHSSVSWQNPQMSRIEQTVFNTPSSIMPSHLSMEQSTSNRLQSQMKPDRKRLTSVGQPLQPMGVVFSGESNNGQQDAHTACTSGYSSLNQYPQTPGISAVDKLPLMRQNVNVHPFPVASPPIINYSMRHSVSSLEPSSPLDHGCSVGDSPAYIHAAHIPMEHPSRMEYPMDHNTHGRAPVNEHISPQWLEQSYQELPDASVESVSAMSVSSDSNIMQLSADFIIKLSSSDFLDDSTELKMLKNII